MRVKFLRRRPPITVEAKWNAVRQFGNRDRAPLQRRRVEHGEIAAVIRSAIDRREQITIALWRFTAARNKDRLRYSVARG